MSKEKIVAVKAGMREKTIHRMQGLAAESDTNLADELEAACVVYLAIRKHLRPGGHIEVINVDGDAVELRWNY